VHRPGPAAEEQRQEARRRGGQVGKTRTFEAGQVSVAFTSTADVTRLLADLCAWMLSGQIDPNVGNGVVYACATALRSLDQGDVEKQLAELRAAVEALRLERAA
jgi:hypothetical protein